MSLGHPLGRRIKFFRSRSGISQFDLENKISASPGTLSRIESGKVNPTKETIANIAKALNINNRELDYLIGITALPPSEEEITQALAEVRSIIDDGRYIGYLLDDRWRILAISIGFPKALGANNKEANDVIGHTIIEVLLEDSLNIRKYFNNEDYEGLLKFQIAYFYIEMHFMFDDPVFIQSWEAIKKNKSALQFWHSLDYNTAKGFLEADSRIVNFQIGPVRIPMKYSREPLLKYPRFEMVEYAPVNKIIKLLVKSI